MQQRFDAIAVATRGPGFVDLTDRIARWLAQTGAADGLLTVFVRHTSASLTIQENADPAVQRDLEETLDGLAPRERRWHHSSEGPDDMPAHVKSMLTATSLAVPVRGGRMMLGVWQGIYLIEHRDRPREREIVLHYIGKVD